MASTTESTSPSLSLAFFIEGMSASGVDTSTQLLAAELRRQGQRVVLFVPWKERCLHTDTGDLYCLPSVRVNRRQAVYWVYPFNLPLFRKFQKEQFDLIHVHTNTAINLLAWELSAVFDLPIVATYHTMAKEYAHYLGPVPERMEKLVDSAIEHYDKLICDRTDAVITPSAKAAAYLHQIGVDTVEIIPNGIDLRAFSAVRSTYLRRRFAIPPDDPLLLFVGRLNQEKRPLLAYTCFRTLQRQHNNVHLVMVGDGALREQLQQQIVTDGLDNNVHLTGLVNYADMPAVYGSADIWLSTSSSEVHPMVALEASASGLPAVAWNDPALAGVIEDGVNGYLVDSPAAFVAALERILADDRLRRQMRRTAIQKGREFRIETTAARVLALYRKVLNDYPSQPRWLPTTVSTPGGK